MLGKRWLWMFSRFLGGSKQLKPPYKQGGGAQNAKIVFTLSALPCGEFTSPQGSAVFSPA
jgi:hypothetical protein